MRRSRTRGQPSPTHGPIPAPRVQRDSAGRWAACLAISLALVITCGCRGGNAPGQGLREHTQTPEVTPLSSPHASRGRPLAVSQWGPKVVLSSAYRAELVALRLTSLTPREALISVELRRRDGKPIPSSITFDVTVTDNRLVRYNVPSTYRSFGLAGEDVGTVAGAEAYSLVETIRIGPLDERVRWFLIAVTVYSQKPSPGHEREFVLTELEGLDLGKQPVPGAAAVGRPQLVSLVGRQVPVYPKASGLNIEEQRDVHAGTLSYVVPGLPYPSRDVADFYSEWALDHGWMPDGRLEGTWRGYLDSTQPGQPWIYQLQVEWTEKESREHLVLTCQYTVPRGPDGHYHADLARDEIVYLNIGPQSPGSPGEDGAK